MSPAGFAHSMRSEVERFIEKKKKKKKKNDFKSFNTACWVEISADGILGYVFSGGWNLAIHIIVYLGDNLCELSRHFFPGGTASVSDLLELPTACKVFSRNVHFRRVRTFTAAQILRYFWGLVKVINASK